MVKKRKPKKSDQNNIEYAYQILVKTMQEHKEVEQSLWAGACWTALVNGYISSNIPFEDFCLDFDSAKEHYSKWWEEECSQE